MFKTLEYVASGSWLYLAVIGGIVVVLALSWKTSLTSLLLSPFKWVWSKITGKKTAATAVPAAPAVVASGLKVVDTVKTDVVKAGNWLTNSRFWKWLAGHNYTPGTHTWLWWVERLGGVAIILTFTHWHAFNLGKDSAPAPSNYKAVVTALALTKKRADTCQKGWDKCETDYAAYFKTDPPSPPLTAETPSLLPLGQPQEIPVVAPPVQPKKVYRKPKRQVSVEAP